MNLDTGELRRLLGSERVPNGFSQLLKEEEEEANKVLGDKNSIILSESHPLRIAVTERIKNSESKKKKRKASKDSRKRNRRK